MYHIYVCLDHAYQIYRYMYYMILYTKKALILELVTCSTPPLTLGMGHLTT